MRVAVRVRVRVRVRVQVRVRVRSLLCWKSVYAAHVGEGSVRRRSSAESSLSDERKPLGLG